MKKILLSCVTCLLALGLVTACDTEEDEKATGGDDSTTQESGDTGETVTSLSNYTLSFTFSVGGEVEMVPDYAVAYISYGKVGQSWGDLMALTATETGAYTITLSSVDVATYEYKIVLCYVDTTPDWSHELTTTNQSFTVEASQGDGYTLEITITSSKSLTDVISDPTIAPRTNYTLEFTLTTPLESGNSLYLIGSFNSWDDTDWRLCTYDDTKGVYTYTFDSIAVDSYTYKGVSCVTGSPSYGSNDDGTWQSYAVIHDGNDGNATFVVSASDKEDGHVKEITVGADGVVVSEDSEEENEDVGTHFYIVFLGQDTSSTSDCSNYYVHSGQSNVFLNNGDSAWHNYVSVTTGTVTSNVCDYIYTSSYGTLEAGESDYFYIYEEAESTYYDEGENDATVLLDISTGTITIPETDADTYAVYVCTVNFGSTSKQEGWYGEWTTGVTDIAAFVSALTLQTSSSEESK